MLGSPDRCSPAKPLQFSARLTAKAGVWSLYTAGLSCGTWCEESAHHASYLCIIHYGSDRVPLSRPSCGSPFGSIPIPEASWEPGQTWVAKQPEQCSVMGRGRVGRSIVVSAQHGIIVQRTSPGSMWQGKCPFARHLSKESLSNRIRSPHSDVECVPVLAPGPGRTVRNCISSQQIQPAGARATRCYKGAAQHCTTIVQPLFICWPQKTSNAFVWVTLDFLWAQTCVTLEPALICRWSACSTSPTFPAPARNGTAQRYCLFDTQTLLQSACPTLVLPYIRLCLKEVEDCPWMCNYEEFIAPSMKAISVLLSSLAYEPNDADSVSSILTSLVRCELSCRISLISIGA